MHMKSYQASKQQVTDYGKMITCTGRGTPGR